MEEICYFIGNAIGFLLGCFLLGYLVVRFWLMKRYYKKYGREMTNGQVITRSILIGMLMSGISLVGRGM